MDERIEKLIAESAAPNDSKRNNELVALLRKQESSIVYSAVEQLIKLDTYNAFEIARRTLTDNKYAKMFFWNGLDLANKSSIEHWLIFALPKLGTRATFKMLKEKENDRPGIIDDALYFLPSLIKPNEESLLTQLRDTLK